MLASGSTGAAVGACKVRDPACSETGGSEEETQSYGESFFFATQSISGLFYVCSHQGDIRPKHTQTRTHTPHTHTHTLTHKLTYTHTDTRTH